MWPLLLVTILTAASGSYLLESARQERITAPHEDALAVNMAIYRSAVISYLSDHRTTFAGNTVTNQDLINAGYLPKAGDPGYAQYGAWRNVVEPSQYRITVYGEGVPLSIGVALSRTAQYSQNAGEARSGQLYAPVSYEQGKLNATGRTLPLALSGSLIPNGAPVWVGNY
jgi:hypothetical protein